MIHTKKILLVLCILMLSTKGMSSQPNIRVLKESKFQEIAEAAHFLANYFELSPYVYIVIDLKPKLSGRVYGYTLHEDHPNHHGIKQFFITINSKLSLKSQLAVIAHEMVHVKQFVHGELIKEQHHAYQWKGRLCQNIHHLDYLDRPWEQEALSMQHKLIDLFKRRAKTVK